jgi:hypothetical protein
VDLSGGSTHTCLGLGGNIGTLEDCHDGVMVVAVNVGGGGECQQEKEDKCDGVATDIDLMEPPFHHVAIAAAAAEFVGEICCRGMGFTFR